MTNIEPCAEIREMAATLRQAYIAYVQAGFTEAQAMQLLTAQSSGVGS